MRINQTPEPVRAAVPKLRARSVIFTSESVSQGHPDKVCDFIADSILDAFLAQDPISRVACQVFCTGDLVVLAGTIVSRAQVDLEATTRRAIRAIGYTDPSASFNARRVRIQNMVTIMLPDIATVAGTQLAQVAVDHRVVFGFATWETPELLPLPISIAHRLARSLAVARKQRLVPWLGADARVQVSVRYVDGKPVAITEVGLLVQHAPTTRWADLVGFVETEILPKGLTERHRNSVNLLVNPTGKFIQGGPEREGGATGRKLETDTYGGLARCSSSGFSGKDAASSDRSAAYFARFVARQLVIAGLADCAELQVAYPLDAAEPICIKVDTRGTGDARLAEEFAKQFDYRLPAILERFELRKPIFSSFTNYGHFGNPNLPWEQ